MKFGAMSCCLMLLLTALPSYSEAQEQERRKLPKSVIVAFREVISEPSKSTVQIYCDGFRAALGAIVRSDGYVVTKASELKGKIECQFSHENSKREAKVFAQDTNCDLAVLRVNAKDLPVVQWATGDVPAVGSWLATPGMTRDPLSVGVVSVAARRLPPNGALGIGLANDDDSAQVTEVREGLAAAQAGMKVGDLIRKVGEEDIHGSEQLRKTIRWHYPGDKVKIVVERNGKLLTVEATLSSLTEVLPRDERSEFQNTLGGTLSERRTGFPMAIQHDSVLRPADCGGPVVDLDGKVIGLNIARAGRVESYALPAATVRDAVDKMLRTELISHPAEERPANRKSTAGNER
jgi:serine protease Do